MPALPFPLASPLGPSSGGPVVMPNPFDSAGNIINDAAVELGLIPFSQKLADPFASVDPNIGKLCQYLKSLGRDLRRVRQWSHLRQTYTFNTVANHGTYALAVDYGQFINQTAWNRTNQLPVGGPLSPQQFQALKARLVGVVFTVLFDVLRQNFQAFPDNSTPGNYVIAYEYVSRFWVVPKVQSAAGQWVTNTVYAASAYSYNSGNLYQTTAGGTSGASAPTHTTGTVSDGTVLWTYIAISIVPTLGAWNNGTVYAAAAFATNGGSIYKTTAGGTSGTYGPSGTGTGISDGAVLWNWFAFAGQDQPLRSDDVVQFDPDMMQKGLQWLYKAKNGWPSDAEKDAFDESVRHVFDDDAVAPALTLGGNGMGEPLIGQQSIPVTGFGQ